MYEEIFLSNETMPKGHLIELTYLSPTTLFLFDDANLYLSMHLPFDA